MDEIGDMSLSAQAKVLRALQENKISRVGSDKDVTVDVRVVAATNKDIRAEIARGNFREDLYHRLGVILIKVPPLRDARATYPNWGTTSSTRSPTNTACSARRSTARRWTPSRRCRGAVISASCATWWNAS